MASKNFYNDEYEKMILGSMILDNDLIDIVANKLKAEYFFSQKNTRIFQTIIKQYEKNKLCTSITLTRELSDDIVYIAQLTDKIASTGNIDFYIEQIKEAWTCRELQKALTNCVSDVGIKESTDILQNLDSKITSLMKFDETRPTKMFDMLGDFFTELEKNVRRTTLYTGYETGWKTFDDVLDGIELGKFIVIGARPSMGKTAFVLNLASKLCSKAKVPMTFFSLEMSYRSLMNRFISFESNISLGHLKSGLKTMETLGKLQAAASRMAEYDLDIIDSSIDNEKELCSRIRIQAKQGKKIFIIDHLGLIEGSDKSTNRYEQVRAITRKVQQLTRELNITIIMLCQLVRGAEGKKPCLADLRESGTIEQDADIIMFLHRERDEDSAIIPTQLIIAKNRDGKIKTLEFDFIPNQTKFSESDGRRNADETAYA